MVPTKESKQPVVANGAEQKDGDKEAAQTAKAIAAAEVFLAALDETQRAKALYAFDSTKRSGWSNLPITSVPRNGVRLGDLTKSQRDAAMSVVAAVCSKEGYQKVVDIMGGDEVLATKGGGKGNKNSFGNDNYFLAIFGKPSPNTPWLVQFGGHHLGLNMTLVGKSFVLTPTHTGTQPASYMRDGKTVRPLGKENDAAFKLVNSLDEKQVALAILKDKNKDLVLGPGKDGKTVQPGGIQASLLNDDQKAMLLEVIGAWVNIMNDDAAAARMAQIKSKLGETYFGWTGPTTDGSTAYYRVQSPVLVIEYASQGSPDHIHTIVRNPLNDYGQQLIKQ
jgi:hypothetical protein